MNMLTKSLRCIKVAAVDTNGAGDTFATAYMLALARHARSPGTDANWVASRAVMHAQACKPQCVLEGIVLGSSYAQYRQWLRAKVTLYSMPNLCSAPC